jgi:hypothetical protein
MSYGDDQQTERTKALFIFFGVAVVCVMFGAMSQFQCDATAREHEAREATIRACIEAGNNPTECRATGLVR